MRRRSFSGALALLVAGALGCGVAIAQQAPFSLDDRFSVLLDRIDALEAELEVLRAERDAAIAELDAASIDRDAAFTERDAAVAELDAAVAGRDALAERVGANEAERDAGRAELDALATERDAASDALIVARADLAVVRARAVDLDERLARSGAESVELRERIAALEGALGAASERANGPAAAVADRPSAGTGPVEAPPTACGDELTSAVTGIVARLTVANPCRAGQPLSVRAARPSDPLIAQLRTRFDGDGAAELVFPVLAADTRLRVFGADRDDWQDVVLSPEADPAGDLAVLRWEDALVDLDLVVGAAGAGAETTGAALDAPPPDLGALVLSQDATSAQLPRFEAFVAAPGAPPIALGVDHASRGARAESPYCDDADAARPRLLLVLRRGGRFEQVRDALRPWPCGQPVPEALRVRALRTLG